MNRKRRLSGGRSRPSSSFSSRAAASRGSSPLSAKPPADRLGELPLLGQQLIFAVHHAHMGHQQPLVSLQGLAPADAAAGALMLRIVNIQDFHIVCHPL